jgi:hypothetical protein
VSSKEERISGQLSFDTYQLSFWFLVLGLGSLRFALGLDCGCCRQIEPKPKIKNPKTKMATDKWQMIYGGFKFEVQL